MLPSESVERPSAVQRLGRNMARVGGRTAHMWWWLPGLLGGLYVVGALSDLHAILTAIYQNSDYAAAPVLAQLLAHAPAGSHVTLGDHGFYEELLALIITRGLPLHRQLWYLAPALFTVGGLGILLWSARRAFGLWSAVIVGSVLACLGDLGLESFFSWDAHGSAAVNAVVLGGALVWLLPRAHSLSWSRVSLAALGLGLFSAPSAGGDQLFLVWGLLPFLVASLLVARSRPGSTRVAVLGVGTAAVALIGGAVFASVMRAHGISDYKPAMSALLTFATPHQLAQNAGTLAEGLTSLAGGNFFGLPAQTIRADVTFVSGGLVLAALAPYWDSISLTWESNFRADVFPVQACASPPYALCSFSEVAISSWYTPRANARSFLIVDPVYPDVSPSRAGLGAPVASTAIGRLHVYVYSYDIASRLGRG